MYNGRRALLSHDIDGYQLTAPTSISPPISAGIFHILQSLVEQDWCFIFFVIKTIEIVEHFNAFEIRPGALS